jgi:hypothetical protein
VVPASVREKPLGEMLRIFWLPKSATSTLPDASTARWYGELKRAALPIASTSPAAVPQLPASVDTAADAVILRTQLLF